MNRHQLNPKQQSSRDEYKEFQERYKGLGEWYKDQLKRIKSRKVLTVPELLEDLKKWDSALIEASTPARQKDTSGVWVQPPIVAIKKEKYYKRERDFIRRLLSFPLEGGVPIDSISIAYHLVVKSKQAQKGKQKEQKELNKFIQSNKHIIAGLRKRFEFLSSPLSRITYRLIISKYLIDNVRSVNRLWALQMIKEAIRDALDPYSKEEYPWVKPYLSESEDSEALERLATHIYDEIDQNQPYIYRVEVRIPPSLIDSVLKLPDVMNEKADSKYADFFVSELNVYNKHGVPYLGILSKSPVHTARTLEYLNEIDLYYPELLTTEQQKDDHFKWTDPADKGDLFQVQQDQKGKYLL